MAPQMGSGPSGNIVHHISSDTNGPTMQFWKKFGSMTLLESTWKHIEGSKSSLLVGTGISALEKSAFLLSLPARVVAHQLAKTYPDAASTVDTVACDCLDMLKVSVPALNEPAEKVIESFRVKTSSTTRRVLRTFPGRQIVYVINSAISASTSIVNFVAPERNKNSYDQKRAKEPVASLTSYKMISSQPNEAGLSFSMRGIAAKPMKLWIRILRAIRRMIANRLKIRRRFRHSSREKPRKEESSLRKKLAPKKQLPQLRFPMRLVSYMLGVYGYNVSVNKRLKDGDIRLYLVPDDVAKASVQTGIHPEKRKHDVLSGEESEVDILDSLDDYDSVDDPDFELPDDDWTTDSMEYFTGDTESDLSFEGDTMCRRIKDKKKTRDRETQITAPETQNKATYMDKVKHESQETQTQQTVMVESGDQTDANDILDTPDAKQTPEKRPTPEKKESPLASFLHSMGKDTKKETKSRKGGEVKKA